MSFLIGAAGTGGHVFPGLAVAEALEELGVERTEILFVGGDRLESQVYPDHGYSFTPVELRGLKRELSLENLRIPGAVWRATQRLRELMAERDVSCALGMGGYVTVPTGYAARRSNVAFFNAEQNAEAGLANRFTSRWAVASFVAFPDTGGLPNGSWVGNPVRKAFWDFSREESRLEALDRYQVTDGVQVVGIFGGSLGARVLNEAAEEIATRAQSPVHVIHLTGQQQFNRERAAATPNWHTVDFEEHMELFFAACDIVVARAGGAVAEITATATPTILVPGEFGSGGHQAGNARYLESAGAAIVLSEAEIHRVPDLVDALLGDEERLRAMRRASQDIAKPRAALTIAEKMIASAQQ